MIRNSCRSPASSIRSSGCSPAAARSTGASPEDAASARSVEILQKRMKVTRQGTTFLVDINVSSESPQKAAVIANAIADGYFEEQVRAKNDATRIAASWLNGQIDELKSRVVASEQAVEDFRSANNLTVSQGVTVNDQQITDLNNKLIAARVQTAEARAKFDQVQQIGQIRRRPRRHQCRDFVGHDHQAAHAICRYREERSRSLQQIRPAPSPRRQCARAAAGHPAPDQRGNPAHPAKHAGTTTTSRSRAKRRCSRASTSCRAFRAPPARRRCACTNCSARPRPTARSMNPIWPATRKPRRKRAWRCRTRTS